MKKISTMQAFSNEILKKQKLTIGLDLGDRWSFYCVLDEAGKIILEQKVPTTPEAMKQTFGKIPRSLIAMETVITPEGSGSVDDRTVACRRQNLYNCPVTARRVAASNGICVVLRIIVASLLFSSALTAVEPDRRFCSGNARRRVSGLHNRTRA
jgi:hypothetical protein